MNKNSKEEFYEKKKYIKKILCILLSVTLVISCAPLVLARDIDNNEDFNDVISALQIVENFKYDMDLPNATLQLDHVTSKYWTS